MRGARSGWTKVLFSPNERRLRAGWRLSLQALLQVVLTAATACGALLLVRPQPLVVQALNPSSTWGLTAAELVEVGTVTLSVWLARRLLDKRPFAGLGLRLSSRTLPDLASGFCIALLTMGFIFMVEWSLGWLSVTGFAWQAEPAQGVVGNTLAFLGIFVLVGWSEELMSRGYHLQTIASGLNLTWGLVLSSAIFGVLHLANPHATVISAAGIFLAGLFLAYAYIRTGQLWCSIGIHIGWNFFEGVVFGFPVSGLDVYRLIRSTVSGPILWTGGPFGPEAGLVVVPAMLVGAAVIHLYGRRYTNRETTSTSRPV